MNEFVYPLLIAAFTAVLTALLTIHIKYAATKEEAVNGLKKLGSRVLNGFWLLYLAYRLYLEVSAEDPLTRADVFEMVLYAICLSIMFIMYMLDRILRVVEQLVGLHKEQIGLHERQSSTTGKIIEYIEKSSKP